MKKLPAPALERGFRILRELEEEDLSLETISKRTSTPKTSTVRALETLVAMSFISRDPLTKKYRSLVKVQFLSRQDKKFQELIHHSLQELSEQVELTSEWYELDENSLLLADRYEPEGLKIRIYARKGFRRSLDMELEAVTRIALNSGVENQHTGSYWVVKQDGQIFSLSQEEQDSLLAKAAKTGIAYDEFFNRIGVRRYATALVDSKGKLLGILALAETYCPIRQNQQKSYSEALLEFKKKINRKISQMEQL